MAYKMYLFDYCYENETWAFKFPATSPEDAQRRLAQVKLGGRYVGELDVEVPAYPGAGWLVRCWCWLRNRLRLNNA